MRGWVVLLMLSSGCMLPTEPGSADVTGADTDASGTTFSTSFTGSASTASTSGSSSTGAVDGSTSSDDDGGTFIVVPDWGGGGPVCGPPDGGLATLPCDVIQQDCPVGEKCSSRWFEIDGAVVPDGNVCVPVDPNPKGLGEPCAIAGGDGSPCDDCDVGLRCWPSADELACAELCSYQHNEGECPTGTACAWMWDANFPLCLPACDPLAPGCGDGFGCVPTLLDEFVCFPALIGEPAALDQPCIREGELPCAAGLACIDAATLGPACTGDDGCCRTLCDLQIPACALDESCVAFFADPPPPQYASLGWCAGA